MQGKGGEHHILPILDSGIAVPPGINVTCLIPNQMNLPPGPFSKDVSPERNGKIDKHSTTFIPLCRAL